MSFVIVPDSSADTATWAPDNPFAPMAINAGDRQFVDDAAANPGQMMDYLAGYKGKSGSACPGIGDWLRGMGEATEAFLVTITSGLSGSYNSACNAARQAAEAGKRVFVVDSLSTAGEMRLIIEKLMELRSSGMGFDQVKEAIAAYQKKTHTLFALESLTNLANNGRVSPLVAKAAGILGIRAVGEASPAGTLEMLAKSRGEKKTVETLCKLMVKAGFKGGKVRMSHAENPGVCKSLSARIQELFPSSDIAFYQARCLNSFYAERGGVIIGFEA